MNQKTYVLYVLLKWLELFYLCTVWAFMIMGTVFLVQQLGSMGLYLKVMAIICCVLCGIQLAYNILLTNIRYTCCNCTNCCCNPYSILNCMCLMCIKPVAKLCEQRPSKTCLVRSLILDGFFVALVVLLYKFKAAHSDMFPGNMESVSNVEIYANVQLEHYLILYVIQIPMFIAARPIVFFVWTLVTCCLPMGEEYDEDNQYHWSIISPDYIEYFAHYRNLESQQRSIQEEQALQRALAEVRGQIDSKNDNLTFSMKFKNGIKKTIFQTFALQNEMGDCPICTIALKSEEDKQKIVLLKCNPLHALHQECYIQWVANEKKNNVKPFCPICRVEIDEEGFELVDNYDAKKQTKETLSQILSKSMVQRVQQNADASPEVQAPNDQMTEQKMMPANAVQMAELQPAQLHHDDYNAIPPQRILENGQRDNLYPLYDPTLPLPLSQIQRQPTNQLKGDLGVVSETQFDQFPQ